ncbi:ABC transporter substrate-binding protein [Coraliomargarita sinensis]|uniref:ABC transporter substrate-binding protein n=1 Tax=Coraliomargarita sinensis TaxID=2174842 RepID=A0A317ZGR2_9BACT|nr:ABC transporter substrate-binding protein [Coraliomargarita sinensis]PXA04766.1 ABC transporter substrate-binding protein [Coraliomargarita sinensis]
MRLLLLAYFTILLSAAFLPASSSEVRHARNFEIIDYGTHRMLSVSNAFRDSTQIHHYALVPKRNELPELPEAATVIRTPVERVVAMETVYIGYLEALAQLDTIIAAATVDYISNPKVRQGVAEGTIQPVQVGQAIDVEKLLLLQPDLLITSVSGDAAFDIPAKLERTGLPIVLSAGYMEQDPLARAEWIKFVAAFFEEDELANQIFDGIEKRYRKLETRTKQIEDKPTVLCGAPYSGVWHVPGGDSYTARMIFDAGGDYLWSEDSTQGGIPLDTERVFLKAAGADYWINPSFYRSMHALYAADARFAKFAPAKNGQVYNNTRQVSPSGGNAIWERGITQPDKVLADLIHIFHPDLLPEHELVYYELLQ